MNFRNLVKPTLFLAITLLSLISCNYILENSKTKSELTKERLTRIQTNKKEAKLLLSAAKTNLDILQLCKELQYVEGDSSIASLAKSLEQTHIEISKNYNELAREKLISVPKQTNIIAKTNTENDTIFIEEHLKQIINKINTQIKLLDTLANVSNNTAFKRLAAKDSLKLKTNKNKIMRVLHI